MCYTLWANNESSNLEFFLKYLQSSCVIAKKLR